MQRTQLPVLVVGGGLAGLTAACFLARAGHAVMLFERSAEPGGRARSTVHAGFTFNLGPHALYTGGAASAALTELNVTYGAQHGPSGVEVLRGGRFDPLPGTPGALLASRLLGPADKLALARLFMTLPRLRATDFAAVSAQDWIERRSKRPAVRRFLVASARTALYSAALHLVSADVLIDKLQRTLTHPIHYLDGGWQTLVNALQERAGVLGVQLVMGQRVDGVVLEDSAARGVRVGGQLVPATAVLLAVPPRVARTLIGASGAPFGPDLLPARVASLDVALSGPPDSPHRVVQDLDAPRFLSTQSSFARVAPDGGTFVTTFKQLDPTLPGDPRADERALEDLLDRAHPGWRARVVHRQFLPNIEAVGALPLARSGGLAGRPDVEVPGLRGLALAGDWVGHEGFLADASFASARRAAERLTQLAPPPPSGAVGPSVAARP